ncbi:MAG: glycoside hydrolase family 127 protein, partial [Verrucomicrobia bacterium]|nr:glycoside hydrolase family 127 protein [Verrucomicrobiota bacterium]
MKQIASILCALCVLSGALSASEQFQFLKVGEVQPRGWLLDQIHTDVTGGYGPVLDKLTDRCEVPVFDCRHKSELAKPKIGEVWWNGETTGNWLDGLIRTAYLSGDAAAKRQVDQMVARILAMQEEDGYLGTYPKALRYEQPVTTKNGELWSQTCLFRGLLAYYEFTGRSEVLEAVRRASKLMISKYGPSRSYWKEGSVGGGGGPGHDIMFVDICEWLYRLTGDKSFVEFSRFLYDGYSELINLREHDIQLRHLADMRALFEGHGAHVMEHLRVPLFVHHATGDTKYRTAAENCFPKTARHLSAGGACISDEGVHQRAGSPNIGCEYCTMLELLNSLQSGVQKTGRAPLADWIELLTFNSAEGARQRDGKAIQYCTRDNQFEAARKGAGSRFKLSPTHDDVAVCCPVTALKFFPYFVNQLWMKAASGDGLVAVSYAPNELTTTVGGVKVRIVTDTVYPFEDEVRMAITPEKPITFALRLRVPGWAGDTKIEPAGASVADADG